MPESNQDSNTYKNSESTPDKSEEELDGNDEPYSNNDPDYDQEAEDSPNGIQNVRVKRVMNLVDGGY